MLGLSFNFLISDVTVHRPQSLKWIPEDQAFSAEQKAAVRLQRIRYCFQIQTRTALELKSTLHDRSCTSPLSGYLFLYAFVHIRHTAIQHINTRGSLNTSGYTAV